MALNHKHKTHTMLIYRKTLVILENWLIDTVSVYYTVYMINPYRHRTKQSNCLSIWDFSSNKRCQKIKYIVHILIGD